VAGEDGGDDRFVFGQVLGGELRAETGGAVGDAEGVNGVEHGDDEAVVAAAHDDAVHREVLGGVQLTARDPGPHLGQEPDELGPVSVGQAIDDPDDGGGL